MTDTTPQPEHSSFNYFDEAMHQADVAAAKEALRAVVAPQFHDLIDHACAAAERLGEVEQHNADQSTWRQILAHFPGIAPALEIVDAHVTSGSQDRVHAARRALRWVIGQVARGSRDRDIIAVAPRTRALLRVELLCYPRDAVLKPHPSCSTDASSRS